jgi:teichuronic acid biosynthesis glycosyltransferase TuaC
MRILVVSRHYDRAGKLTGGNVHRQCVELRSLEIDVEVICPLPRWHLDSGVARNLRRLTLRPRSLVLDGIDVTYVPYSNIPQRLSAAFDGVSLRRALISVLRVRRGPRIDLVHAHMLFPTAWSVLPVARSLGAPLVVTAHGSDVHTNPARNRGIARCTSEVIERSDQILAVSSDLAQDALRLGTPSRKILVSHFGVDAAHFQPVRDKEALRERLGLPIPGPGICNLGRLAWQKGVRELLEAFEQVAASHPRAWLLFVGDGPARSALEERSRALDLHERVHFAGGCPHEQVPQWLAAADVFAFPSYKEGLPNVILEAMACGVPIIATDVGGVSEAVGEEGALFVPPRDIPALAQAMDRLLCSPEVGEHLASRGLRRVRTQFSWRQSAQALRSVYEGLLAAPIRGG